MAFKVGDYVGAVWEVTSIGRVVRVGDYNYFRAATSTVRLGFMAIEVQWIAPHEWTLVGNCQYTLPDLEDIYKLRPLSQNEMILMLLNVDSGDA